MGSMRGERVLEAALAVELAGYRAFADWFAPGPEADDYWKRYAQARGLSYGDALHEPHARNVFEFDQRWLRAADAGLLVCPAGKSAWAEMGLLRGWGKPVYAWLEKDPERWDIMLQIASGWSSDLNELISKVFKLHRP